MLPDWVLNPGPLTYESDALLRYAARPQFPGALILLEIKTQNSLLLGSSIGTFCLQVFLLM